jgi:hypothetical protein
MQKGLGDEGKRIGMLQEKKNAEEYSRSGEQQLRQGAGQIAQVKTLVPGNSWIFSYSMLVSQHHGQFVKNMAVPVLVKANIRQFLNSATDCRLFSEFSFPLDLCL